MKKLPIRHLPQNIEKLGGMSWPFALDCLHGCEQELELPHSDAVGGENTQQFNKKISDNLQG